MGTVDRVLPWRRHHESVTPAELAPLLAAYRARHPKARIATITNATSFTLLEAFAPALPVGTAYERIDGFDHTSVVEIPMIQEKQAPDITTWSRADIGARCVSAYPTTPST